MTEQITFREKRVWKFTYKGLHCEIVNWSYEEPLDGHPTGNWNGYITIAKRQLPDRFSELLCDSKGDDRKYWDYYKLDDLFDMQGGITYYEPIRDQFSNEIIGIKVGNDYMHLWDDGQSYTKEYIARDLMHSVATFITKFPEFKERE